MGYLTEKAVLVNSNPDAVEAKRGQPVRLEPDVVSMARRVAEFHGMSIGEYISATLRPTVRQEYLKMVREEDAKGGGK
jgi:hypothetical protein